MEHIRQVPGLSEPGGPAGNPHVGRAAATTRGGRRVGTVGVGESATGVGGPRGEQEARLLELGGDGSILSNGGANNVADGVVAENSVSSASAAQCVVAPAVEGLAAKTAG